MRIQTIKLLILALAALAASCTPPDKPAQDKAHESVRDTAAVMALGKETAQAGFAALSTALQQAIQRGGLEEGINFCHVAALPLTDSLSTAQGAIVKRTSLKTRNPLNRPDGTERAILDTYQAEKEAGREPGPLVTWLEDGTALFTAPILTGPQCLNCHGTAGETLLPSTLALINERYPDDQAVGYTAGTLRGMWAIRFPPNQK